MKLVVVCGPTACGKTTLAVSLSQSLTAAGVRAEIVNADSMQIYAGMEIATATPSENERSGIPHHLFGFVEPSREYSVADWLTEARAAIAEIAERGGLPVIVGGTGLYITSLIENITFDDTQADPRFREEMQRLAQERGNTYLWERLREVDPEAAAKLHENNVKRVIRALEAAEISGKLAEERLAESRAVPSPYRTLMFAVDCADRDALYERINRRVDSMLAAGLVEEARRFCPEGLAGKTAAAAIGHKELLPFLRGELPLEVCVEELKRKTRNYAKRQMTWFNRYKKDNGNKFSGNLCIDWVSLNKVAQHIENPEIMRNIALNFWKNS